MRSFCSVDGFNSAAQTAAPPARPTGPIWQGVSGSSSDEPNSKARQTSQLETDQLPAMPHGLTCQQGMGSSLLQSQVINTYTLTATSLHVPPLMQMHESYNHSSMQTASWAAKPSTACPGALTGRGCTRRMANQPRWRPKQH